MVIVAFFLSLVAAGVVLSAVPTKSVSPIHLVDYHYVPYAGDAFGHRQSIPFA